MTPENLAKHRTNPNMAFWKMIKIGNDHFEATHLEPKVEVCNRRYVFDAQPARHSSNTLVFDPTGKCPAFVVNSTIARAVLEKQHADDVQYKKIDQGQCASRGNPEGTGWRNEPSLPRPAWGQNATREPAAPGISSRATPTGRYDKVDCITSLQLATSV